MFGPSRPGSTGTSRAAGRRSSRTSWQKNSSTIRRRRRSTAPSRPLRRSSPRVNRRRPRRMPSLIDLRRRIRAVKNTQQITKAMKMVAASKLRRAQMRVVNARPYAVQMQRVLGSVAARVDPSLHPLLERRELRPESKTLVFIVTADKGLCGSFNTNIIKAGAAFIVGSTQPCAVGLVGRKGRDYFGRRGFDVFYEQVGIFQKL